MSQVGLGEQLAAQGILHPLPLRTQLNYVSGPTFYLPAAMAFYRALRVYPSPVELIVIYQKTIPEAVFKARFSRLFWFIDTYVTTRLSWTSPISM